MNQDVLGLQLPMQGRREAMKIDIGSLSIGGLLVAVISAVVALLTQYKKSKTDITIHTIDDRGKVTSDANKLAELFGQRLSSVESRLATAEETVSHLQAREAIYNLGIAKIGGELRALNGYLEVHLIQLKMTDALDREILIGQAELMSAAMKRIRDGMDADQQLLIKDYTNPSH